MSNFKRTDFDLARDELMSHIHRCGVLQATEEQQAAWMEDTMEYMLERFPALTTEQLGELRTIGLRFCQPVIAHGKQHTALTVQEEAEEEAVEEQEMAGSA